MMKKTGLSYKEVLQRRKQQLPLKQKERMADYIIENNGSMRQMERRTKKIWEEIHNG